MGRKKVVENARTFTLLADKNQIADLQQYAIKTGQTTGDVIRQAIRRFVALKRVRKAIGRD